MCNNSNQIMSENVDPNDIINNYKPFVPEINDPLFTIESYNKWYQNYYLNCSASSASSSPSLILSPFSLSNVYDRSFIFEYNIPISPLSPITTSDNSHNVDTSDSQSNSSMNENEQYKDLSVKQKMTPVLISKQSSAYDKYSRKHQLPDRAVDIMNEWFDDHINNPYPTMEQKEKLARLGRITVKQVTAWFSNRRNRSQNTKPKRMKRDFEKEITNIFTQLESNDQNEKEHLIQKLKHVYF